MLNILIKDDKIYFESNNEVRLVFKGEVDDIITPKGQWINFNGELVKVPDPSIEAPDKYTDVATLPDNTFFYVKNGCWNGFVTSENGIKVMYIGVGDRFGNFDKAKTLADIPEMIKGRYKKAIISYNAIISDVKTITN